MSMQKLISSFVCTAVMVAVFVPSLAAQDPLSGWKADGNLSALALTRVTESKQLTILEFKNVSGKVISAAAISFHDMKDTLTNRYEDWINDNPAGLANGGVFAIEIGTEEAAELGRRLEISAVVFEDGTSRGMSHQLDVIKFGRLGKMLETERIRNLLAAPGEQYLQEEGVKALAEKIVKLPRTHDEALASVEKHIPPGVTFLDLATADEGIRQSFFQGVQNARYQMLKKIDQLRQLPVTSKEPRAQTRGAFLSDLARSCEIQSTRYRSMWERTQGGKRHD
jgi:hypothetical protein